MKVTRNDDGSVTVAIPKAPEEYDPSDGVLYISETLPKAEFDKAAKVPAKKAAKSK